MFFVCERVRKAAADERQPQRAERAMHKERAEAFFPLFDCSLPLAADRAGVAAYFVVARRRRACRLAPTQHGGARSGCERRRRRRIHRAIARAVPKEGISRRLGGP
jgi:hypothetical protein